jgi:hypothetical protein
MTRRTPAQYDFTRGLYDELLLPTSGSRRRSTFPRRGKVKHIDIHHMTVKDSTNGSANEACVSIWKTREASAHYGVDNHEIAQFVYDNREAWGNANSRANQEGIIVEHANARTGDASGWPISDATIASSVRLVASLHVIHKLGRPTSTGFGDGGTIRTHQSFYSTSCPGPYFRKIWKTYVAKVQAEYDRIAKKGPAKPSTVRHFEHRHLNTWGDDGAAGTASLLHRIDDMVADLVSGVNPEVITLNEVQDDDIASWEKRLIAEGYDVPLAAAGNLVAVPRGTEIRKAQTKYLPANIQGEGRREALGMVRAKINGHWEHIFVSHLDYRDGAKFDALRVKQADWITDQAKRWSVTFVLKNWRTHTTIGLDENSGSWVRDKAFLPAGFKAAVKSGIDAIYGNRPTENARAIVTKSDHPIVAVTYTKAA